MRFAGRVLSLMLLCTWVGNTAVVSIANQAGSPGQLFPAPIALFTEGAALSGAQFDLEWDQPLAIQIAPGAGIVNSGKLLYSAPLAPAKVRILVVGLNQAALPDGELIRLFVAGGTAAGSFQIRLTNLVGSSASGDAVSLRSTSATVRIDAGSPGTALLAESVLNAASLRAGPLAPGEIVTLIGAFAIAPASSAGISVSVNGTPANVLYAVGNQINLVMPPDLDATRPATLTLRNQDRQIAQTTVPTATASPAVFTMNGTGIGPGAILNQDYSPNSAENPASAGSIVMVYGTGFGPLPVTAAIDGIPAAVLYAGAAPGLPAGVAQLNIQVPGGVPPRLANLLSISAGSFQIQSGVTVTLH